MGSRDFNNQMEEVWEKITGSGDLSLSNDFEREILNTRQEIAMESVQILRSRYRREKEYWIDLFKKKDVEINTLHDKLSSFEKELHVTHEALDKERLLAAERLKADVESFHEKQGELARCEEAFKNELAYHQHAAEDAHARLAVEKENFTKLRERWTVKEKAWDSLIRDREEETAKIREEYAEKELELFNKQRKIGDDKDTLELEVNRLASALEAERRHHTAQSKDSVVKLGELQEALDKAYKQLEMEQKLRDINVKEFKQYKAEIQELKDGRQRMLEEWDKERASWKELWDKERLIWDKRKEEVVEWEKRLRQERERWILSGVSEPEKLLKEFFQQPSGIPPIPAQEKETVPREEKKPYLRPILAATWNAVLLRRRTRAQRIVYGGFFAITILFSTVLLYRGKEIYPLPQITPAAFTLQGKDLAVFDKQKASLFFFSTSKMNLPVRTVKISAEYSIDSLVIAGGFIWSCDTKGNRIRLHRTKNPQQLEGVFPAPGPKTTLIAWDGDNLWSYDAAQQKVYVHNKDPLITVHKKFDLPDVDPAALCWWNGALWIYDRFTQEVLKYEIDGERLKKADSYFLSRKLSLMPVRDVNGIGFARGGLWISGGKEQKLVRYNLNRIKLYNLPF